MFQLCFANVIYYTDLDQYAGGLIEVRIPSDGLIESMKAADPDNYKGLDSDWGTVVVRRIGQTDGNDDDGKAEFHWSNQAIHFFILSTP